MVDRDLELKRYHQDLRQEVFSLVAAEEEGASTEEKFTDYVLGILADAGETENARVCTDIREDSIGRRRHKINGYSIDDSFESVDLFVSIYNNAETIQSVTKADIDRSAGLAKRFLLSGINGYHMDIEESSPVFDLAHLLYKHDKDLVRANIFIISDGVSSHDALAQETVRNDILITYQVWDLERFHRLWTSTNRREPIVIDFYEYGRPIPCLSLPLVNEEYECYLAIIPGQVLSNIYREYGSRLLEQNVRTFLQFTGKVNRGIRDTIREEPHMFLPYNNGIACTAEAVDLESSADGLALRRVKDFQIVNGGQTTASLFHAQRKDKSDLAKIYLQLKLTIIKNRDHFSDVVSRISKYANSQNKVSDADLTSNNPFHVRLEELSRGIWAPDTAGLGNQTRWFFERARGQYRDAQNRELTTKRRKAYEAKNPSRQRFQKEDIAKFYHSWECKPFWVARGRQKNYAHFMATVVKKIKLDVVDSVFFEDLIAKAILFKTGERLYGRGTNAIGDIRFIAVPYAISLLYQTTDGNIDLYKLWKNQAVSEELSTLLRALLEQSDFLIKKGAQERDILVSEWAKKEECWTDICSLSLDISSIASDLRSVGDDRYDREKKDAATLLKHARLEEIRSVPVPVWKEIEEWGRVTDTLNAFQRNIAFNVAGKLRSQMALTASEEDHAYKILQIILDHNPQLLEPADDPGYTLQDEVPSFSVGSEDLKRLLSWERQQRRLAPWKYQFVKKRLEDAWPPGEHELNKLRDIIAEAKRGGFELSSEIPAK